MSKPNVEAAVDDLVGQPAKSDAKPAAAKAAAPKKAAAAPAANKKAAPAANKKPAAPAAKKPATPPAKSGAKSPAKPAKPAAKAATDKAARGAGKYYFSPEDREALGKELKQKVRKPTTTAEYGAAHNVPTWKVRLAAVTAGLKLQKTGAVLTMHPAK